jgi:adenosylcobinamide kinase / adenosylcobinamide-phosphate guanylyltransferase
MSTVYLVTGGARSGKSGHAQGLCEQLSPNPIYVATARAVYGGSNDDGDVDQDFAHRIQKHRQDRGEEWTTVEAPLRPSEFIEQFKGRVVLVDCLTLWLTNFMMEEGVFSLSDEEDASSSNNNKKEDRAAATAAATKQREASERALAKVKDEFDQLTTPWNCTYVFVTNELGSGTHAHDHVTRKFVDAQGWLNQYVARRAETVIHMVCGCPHVIKGPSPKSPSSPPGELRTPTRQQARTAAMLDGFLSKRGMVMDTKGYFLVKVDREKLVIRVSFHSCIVNDRGEFFDLEGNRLMCHGGSPEPLKVWECRTAKELTVQVLEQWEPAKDLLNVGHAGYLGREVQKAEVALYNGTCYQQD